MQSFSTDELIGKYLPHDSLSRFLDYAEKANRSFNLFSRNTAHHSLKTMIAESLIPLDQGWVDNNSGPLLDIGSGWGVPAVPLALADPDLDITMLERSQKKADFLMLLSRQLKISPRIINRDLASLADNHEFKTVTLRGVAVDNKLIKRLHNIVDHGGGLIYFGSNFPADLIDSSKIIDYSIDNLPVRHIIKYLLK